MIKSLYYVEQLLDAALQSEEQRRFLVAECVEHFRGFGGVRTIL